MPSVGLDHLDEDFDLPIRPKRARIKIKHSKKGKFKASRLGGIPISSFLGPKVGFGAQANKLSEASLSESLPCDGQPLTLDTLGVPAKMWIKGVMLEENARRQIEQICNMPYVKHHVAVMPDAHAGKGACVGTVICCRAQLSPLEIDNGVVAGIPPAAVGVDIGCGMLAWKLDLTRQSLASTSLARMRSEIEKAVPHGRTDNGGRLDEGAWPENRIPPMVQNAWQKLESKWRNICEKHPHLYHRMAMRQMGTMGTGNHFLEICADENQEIWVMLHSGSRGPGNKIGTYFTQLAQKEVRQKGLELVDKDLAWLEIDSDSCEDYLEAMDWAQKYAWESREIMILCAMESMKKFLDREIKASTKVHCHHNFVARERHFDEEALIIRKGAIRATEGSLAIIPGSMGAKSFIVEGLGNPESFSSASHGAGRMMSRGQALRTITLAQHDVDMSGIEARRDRNVLDESPRAYKPIEAVMQAQSTLCKPKHTLRQLLVVKG